MALTGDLRRGDPRCDSFLTSRGLFATARADTINASGKQVYVSTPPAPTPQP